MKNIKTIITSCLLVSILYSILYIPYSAPTALAFDATSTSFELHAGDIESTVGSSTSATFGLRNAGGQNATASSSATTKSISAGILYWLFGFFNAQYTQVHYRWRDDNGTNETDATFPINLDIQYPSFPKNTVKRLRFEVSNEGWTRGAAPALTLEVAQTATCSSGTYAMVPTDYSGHWHIATSTKFVNGDPTTNVSISGGLTDENANFVTGRIMDTGTTTIPITLTSSDFTEVEFAVMALDAATNANPYCFRLTNSGATSGTGYAFSYVFSGQEKYAIASVASGLPATGTLESAVFDTFTTATSSQGPAYNSIMWNGTVGTDEGTGKVRFQLATSDCANGLDYSSGCTTGAGWTFYGNQSGTCSTGNYYDTLTSGAGGGPGVPVEISCSASQSQNNKRYFKYRIQICSSADCTSSGATSPVVRGVVVNWAP